MFYGFVADCGDCVWCGTGFLVILANLRISGLGCFGVLLGLGFGFFRLLGWILLILLFRVFGFGVFHAYGFGGFWVACDWCKAGFLVILDEFGHFLGLGVSFWLFTEFECFDFVLRLLGLGLLTLVFGFLGFIVCCFVWLDELWVVDIT